MRRLAQWILRVAAVLLLVGVALGYGGPVHYELDLLAHFRFHFLLLAAALAVIAVLLRERPALTLSAAAAIGALAGLGVLWQQPEQPEPPGSGRELTVMIANVYSRNAVPEEARRALLEADADILVTAEPPVALYSEPLSLGNDYPHHTRLPPFQLVADPSIWSKFPILEAHLLKSGQTAYGVRAVVEIAPGQPLTVIALHLAHVFVDVQHEQVQHLATEAADLSGPRIVMGDFNATAWSHGLRRVEEVTGTRRVPGVNLTWKGWYPSPLGRIEELLGLPIDHILVSGDLGVEEMEAVPIPGSDHLAVRAVLRVPPGPSAGAGGALSMSP